MADCNKRQYILPENIRVITSGRPGKKICVLGGVHGNEIAGIRAVKELSNELKIETGKVTLVICNERAILHNKRFIDENLNRCFNRYRRRTGSYEEGIAQELKMVLRKQDVCIDIHNSNTPESQPFAICERNAEAILASVPVRKIVSGFDELEPGGTDHYMNLLGRIGICIECGYADDANSVNFAKETIINILKKTGNIRQDWRRYPGKERFRLCKRYIPKKDFVKAKDFADFDPLRKGQAIGMDGKKSIKAEEACRILFAKDVNKSEDTQGEAFLLIRVGAKFSLRSAAPARTTTNLTIARHPVSLSNLGFVRSYECCGIRNWTSPASRKGLTKGARNRGAAHFRTNPLLSKRYINKNR